MLTKLSTFFYRFASWKTLLLGFVLYIPFPAYFFKNLNAAIHAQAGGDAVELIDGLVGYEPAKISEMVEAYGAKGRAIYAQGELTLDIAHSFIYTYMACVLLTLLFRHRTYTSFRLVNVIPVGMLVFDLLENGCIVYLLKTYPEPSPVVTSVCSALTNLKWTMFMIVLGLVLYGLVKMIIRNGQRKSGQSS